SGTDHQLHQDVVRHGAGQVHPDVGLRAQAQQLPVRTARAHHQGVALALLHQLQRGQGLAGRSAGAAGDAVLAGGGGGSGQAQRVLGGFHAHRAHAVQVQLQVARLGLVAALFSQGGAGNDGQAQQQGKQVPHVGSPLDARRGQASSRQRRSGMAAAIRPTPTATPIHRSQVPSTCQLLASFNSLTITWLGSSTLMFCRFSMSRRARVPGITLISPRYTAAYQIAPNGSSSDGTTRPAVKPRMLIITQPSTGTTTAHRNGLLRTRAEQNISQPTAGSVHSMSSSTVASMCPATVNGCEWVNRALVPGRLPASMVTAATSHRITPTTRPMASDI